jgi:tryptophanyl-tRNA synthetase
MASNRISGPVLDGGMSDPLQQLRQRCVLLTTAAYPAPQGTQSDKSQAEAGGWWLRHVEALSRSFFFPDVYIPKVGARIMSLQEPMKKMSKSDENENACIYLLDSPEVIKKKFKRAVTDSIGKVQLSDDQPGIKNLISIYSVCKNVSPEEVVAKFENEGYGVFKEDVADAVIEVLKPVQDKFHELMNNKAYLEEVYKSGADRAERVARKTLRKMYKKVGFIPR